MVKDTPQSPLPPVFFRPVTSTRAVVDSMGMDASRSNEPHPFHSPESLEVPLAIAPTAIAGVHHTSSVPDALNGRTSSNAHRSTPFYHSPIYKLPLGLLLNIFEIAAPSRTREDLLTVLNLTHVCQAWKELLIDSPRFWTSIFATQRDRRGLVELCLERSRDLPLEVNVDINDKLWVPTGCSCDKDEYGMLLPSERSPCEWHFLFELLAHPSNSERIEVLRTDSSSKVLVHPGVSTRALFDDFSSRIFSLPCAFERYPGSSTHFSYHRFTPSLKLENCKFFHSTFPRLTTLTWKDDGTKYAHRLFSAPDCLSALQSMTFEGYWHNSLSLPQLNNLTSFAIKRLIWTLNAEDFRLFLSENQSLVSLEVSIDIRGETSGPPVDLLELKSLSIDSSAEALSTIAHIPAFKRLSVLKISLEDGSDDLYTLRATGDGISLLVKSKTPKVPEDWQHLVGYTGPTIRHVRAHDQLRMDMTPPSCESCTKITPLMVNAHTAEFGLSYLGCWGDELWNELRLLKVLKTIRFEVWEEIPPYGEPDDSDDESDGYLWDKIADLVEHFFKEGRPLHAIERMVVSEDEEANRIQDDLWRQFIDGRNVTKYLAASRK